MSLAQTYTAIEPLVSQWLNEVMGAEPTEQVITDRIESDIKKRLDNGGFDFDSIGLEADGQHSVVVKSRDRNDFGRRSFFRF